MTYYRETQGAALWVYVLLAGIIVVSVFWPLFVDIGREAEKEGQVLMISALAACITVSIVMNLMCLRTDVERERIYVRLGVLFPMMWWRLPLDDIDAVEVVEYRPIRDAGGWGYRLGKFNGRVCRYYNMRGNRGVLITTCQNKQHIIGSQTPEALAAAIREAVDRLH